jgi:Ca2+-binding EF-hand superfamily protein
MIPSILATERSRSLGVELRCPTAIPAHRPGENFNKTFRNNQTSRRLDDLATVQQWECYRKRQLGQRKNYSDAGNWFTKPHQISFPICRVHLIDKESQMRRPFLIAGIACVALLVCVVVKAADDDNAALFDRLDANHDGQITADEVPAEQRGLFDRLLRRADRNGDGKLSREEFMSGLADRQPSPPVDQPDRARSGRAEDPSNEDAKIRNYATSIIKQFDTNGDGVLDKSEWSKLNNAEQFDRNHDGKITLDEIIETLRPAQRASEGQNEMPRDRGPMGGGFGMGGMRGGAANAGGGFGGGGGAMGDGMRPMVGAALFHALDTNNDGKLDAKEIAAASEVLKKLANASGEITREELLQSLPPGLGPGAGGGGRGGFGGIFGGGAGGQNPNGALMSFDQILKALDKNGDGKLQKSELPPRLQDQFEQFDTNHDGVLDESEFKQILPRFARQLQQRAENRNGGEPPARRPMRPEDNKPEGN